MKMSTTKFFRGICTEAELIEFFRQLTGDVFHDKIPKEAIAIPISKKRPDCHQVFGYDNNGVIQLQPKKTIMIGSLDCNIYPIDQVMRVKCRSKNGNEIIFARDDVGGKFFIDLRQKSYGSFYLEAFKRVGIKIVCPAT